jgi:hypothetical protein
MKPLCIEYDEYGTAELHMPDDVCEALHDRLDSLGWLVAFWEDCLTGLGGLCVTMLPDESRGLPELYADVWRELRIP